METIEFPRETWHGIAASVPEDMYDAHMAATGPPESQ